MKTFLLIMLLAGSFQIGANDDSPKAPQKAVNEAIETCTKYAEEDEVPETEHKSFMLLCVNDELEDQGYQKVESLD